MYGYDLLCFDRGQENIGFTNRPRIRARLACVLVVTFLAGCGDSIDDRDILVGLITKTSANPFFVVMEEAAVQRSRELGIELRTYTGEYDGDWRTQAAAVESLIAAGATGILITPSDPAALTDMMRAAREEGVLVIALDTPFDPAATVDATFATNNFTAGELIGRWARAIADASYDEVRIATLDGWDTPITVDVLRNQGFLDGFGVDIRDPGTIGDEDDPRLVGRAVTRGTEAGGRAAMEDLIRKNLGFNVVYTVNEPAAAGAYAALEGGAGLGEDVLIVSVDGGCAGVESVAAGMIDATAMQFPRRMATLGVEAVVEFVRTGTKPDTTPGLDFRDTGVTLVTDQPVPGIRSLTAEQAMSECWG